MSAPRVDISVFCANASYIDAFQNQTTEIFIIQMLTKNLLFYGFSLFINHWEIKVGGPHVFTTFGIVALFLIATSVPMYR